MNSEAMFRQQSVAVKKSTLERDSWITSQLSIPIVSNQNLVERLIGSSDMMEKDLLKQKVWIQTVERMLYTWCSCKS